MACHFQFTAYLVAIFWFKENNSWLDRDLKSGLYHVIHYIDLHKCKLYVKTPPYMVALFFCS